VCGTSDGRVAPDANEEYLLYQTIAGVWPWRDDEPGCRESLLKRLQEYAAKALSEVVTRGQNRSRAVPTRGQRAKRFCPPYQSVRQE